MEEDLNKIGKAASMAGAAGFLAVPERVICLARLFLYCFVKK
jgi:hypothetical protein